MSYTMGACAAEITGGDSYANVNIISIKCTFCEGHLLKKYSSIEFYYLHIQMIREKLYNPLGMNSTMFPATDQDWSQDFARHYVWYNGRHEPLDMKLVEYVL